MIQRLASYYLFYLSPDRDFARTIYQLTGMRPRGLEIYRQAFRHSSLSGSGGSSESNERLEFLGDAILGSVVADHLFRTYPRRNEGYLTEMRSRMVSRMALNDLGRRMGICELLQYRRDNKSLTNSAAGNTLEAFIGAVYLDQGHDRCRRYIIRQLLQPYFDLEALEQNDLNFKSQLLRWVQAKRLPQPTFVVLEVKEDASSGALFFRVACKLGGSTVGVGSDRSKKSAEQKAAQDAYTRLVEAEKAELAEPSF